MTEECKSEVGLEWDFEELEQKERLMVSTEKNKRERFG